MTRFAALFSLSFILQLGSAVAQDDDAFVRFMALKPAVALEMAQAALESCQAAGYQVGVSVVDRSGTPQIFLRDRFAGPHVVETAERKAWTAVSFRSSTLELGNVTQPNAVSFGIRYISKALPLGGGLPVLEGDGSIVAGIGVSGAPSPEADEVCAQDGIDAIADQIAF